MLQLSQAAARAMLLATQGLDRRPDRPATRDDLLAAIRRMGALQIDTIHVVARSPYLVLWSRLGDYQPRWLDELLAGGALFEYWSHEACFLPIDDYPLYRRLMLEGISRSWTYSHEWMEANREGVDQLLALVRQRGEVRSSDFARADGQASTWWNWKFEKMALEMLFTAGELMIARREHFQRVYTTREQLMPDWSDDQAPPIGEVRRTLALEAVRALGVARAGWVADYFRTARRETAALPAALADEGRLLRVQVAGWDEPGYVHPENAKLAETAASGTLVPSLTTLLSPFDPVVWDRKRALELFGFDYRIECYTPAPKRRYGYFTLPILRHGELIGRLDPKAHRKEQLFEVKALHLDPGVPLSDALVADIARALRECAAWHGTPQVVIRRSDPPEIAELIERTSMK